MRKLVFAATAVTLLIGTAAAQTFQPSHPLSHIHPVDIDLNMSGQDIYNVTEFSLDQGLSMKGPTIFEPDSDGAAAILTWNDSRPAWEIRNGSVDMNGGDIYNYFQNICSGETRVVNGINANGTYDCIAINQSVDDLYVNQDGDTMEGDLNFSQYDINNVSDITNFFEDNCGNGEIVRRVYDNGSYDCVNPNENDEFAQNLSEVLDIGNQAGDESIDMTGQTILNIGTGRANFSSQGGLRLTGNLDMNNFNIRDLENLYRNDSQGNFFQDTCGDLRAIQGIHPNGSYKCTQEILEEETEYLNETLQAGNSAGNNSILMNGNNLVLEGGYLTNDTDDDGLRVDNSGRIGINVLPVADRSLNVNQVAGFRNSVEIADSIDGTANSIQFIGNNDARITGAENFAGNSNSIYIDNPNAQPIIFETNNNERFRIAGDGEQISFNDLNMTENNIQNVRAIQDGGGVDSLVFDEDNNLRVSNGNLNVTQDIVFETTTGSIRDVESIWMQDRGSTGNKWKIIESNGENGLLLSNGGNQRLIVGNNGNLRVPNGNINLTQNQLDDVSRIDFTRGGSSAFIEEYGGDSLAINSQGNVLRLQDSSSTEISAESDVRLNANDINNVREVRLNDNDSSGTVFRIREASNGELVLEQGTAQRIQVGQNVSIPNDDLDLNENDLYEVANLYGDDSQGNFFDPACGQFRALQGIHPNGSFICTEEILEEETEGLNETLDKGNWAGNRDIYMNQSQILEIGTGETNFTNDGGMEIAGDVSLNNNNLNLVDTVNSGGTDLTVEAAQTDFNNNQINNISKIGVNTPNPDENLDVEGTANISTSSGTSMNVQANGNVVVTLG